MTYKIEWNKSAVQDLEEILDYMIDNGDEENAYNIYLQIKERAEQLKISPEQGRKISELTSLGNRYREIIVKPWRIIYRIDKNLVNILMIIDSRRNFEDILFDKLIQTDSY